jgi:sugar (pentulose or hexulose) kinase
LFNFFLTGEKINEFTISTTTQCFNPITSEWCLDILSAFGIPSDIFGKSTPPGTGLGPLLPSVAQQAALPPVQVVASAGHDTACAFAAVPSLEEDAIFISSGTWSLMGIEVDSPIISSESLEIGMSNEGGVENKIRFLKNMSGMWLIQECLRKWNQQGTQFSYEELTQMAEIAQAHTSLVLPTDQRFMSPQDMPAAIQAFCQETGQNLPTDTGAVIRCILESLALEYRKVVGQIEGITGRHYSTIHIVGGGSKNALLNQFVADATGRNVFAGPVEATVLGNILVQMLGMGDIQSLNEGRKLILNSFDIKTYEPKDQNSWDEAYARYEALESRSTG